MSNSHRHNKWTTSLNEYNVNDSLYRTRLSAFINRLHTSSTGILIAGIMQVVLGITVIVVSVLGYVAPLWVSTLLTGLSSIATMIGLGLIYYTVSKRHDPNMLLRNAMKRVMESKN